MLGEEYSSFALTEDRKVYAWGYNGYGQLIGIIAYVLYLVSQYISLHINTYILTFF